MTLKQASLSDWSLRRDTPDESEIRTGAFQRIADATEVMARRFNDLIEERDRYERYYRQERARAQKLEWRVRSLRDAITRLKAGKPQPEAKP